MKSTLHLLTVSFLILKTELWISDFEYFHRLAGHRLSVQAIPAVPNMVKERVCNKARRNIFVAVTKHGRQKPFWTRISRGRNRCFS